jgi:transporter family-2 protein
MTMVYYAALAIVMGVAVSIYLPMQANGGRILGAPALFNAVFFFFGMVTSAVVFFATGGKFATIAKLAEVPAWLYLSGIVSGLMILGSTFLIPRIGAGPFFVLLVAGQITAGLVISHFGLLNTPVDPVTLRKILGVVAVVGGAALVTLK